MFWEARPGQIAFHADILIRMYLWALAARPLGPTVGVTNPNLGQDTVRYTLLGQFTKIVA
jgi:hypothetical protein